MIAQLRGTVIAKNGNALILDVEGVGYEVQLSTRDIDECHEEQDLVIATHLSIRENAHELYGFIEVGAKQLFSRLLSVSGVGPKVALSILSLGPVGEVQAAIASGDTNYISAASGVGKRVAEKVVVELRGKIDGIVTGEDAGANVTVDDAFGALLALGYTSTQARQALVNTQGSVEERIKAALKQL